MQRLGNWLSSTGRDVLGQLAESVAPLFRTNLEQFQFAWKKIDEEYGHMMAQADVDLDDPTVLTNSKMIDHLNTLVEALVKEEEEQSSKNLQTGPCFEFLLERGVLDKLCALGLPDRPPGMRVLVTKTLDAILQHTQHPILPNMHIHAAVRQFIDVSFKQDDLHKRRAKSSYVSLLKTLCIKVRDDPSLAGIFFDEHAEQKGAKPEFMLFGALLSVANNEDDDGRAACEGLLCCLQVPHVRMAKWIVDGSPFCQLIVKGLCERWEKMPKVLKSDNVDDLPKDNPTIDSFYERLAYIDVIAACSYPIVGQGIAKCFVEQFLHRCLQPRLMDVEEKTATCATVYLRRIVQKLDAYHMVNPLLNFLLGDGHEQETKADEKSHVVRTTLIKRMDSLSEPLTLSTLALFDSLIAMKNQSVISNLILRNLVSLNHIDASRRADYKPILAGTGDGKEGPALRKRMLAPFGTLTDLDKHPSYEDYLVDAQAEGQMWFSAVERWEPMGRSPLAEPHVPSASLPAVASSSTTTPSSDATTAPTTDVTSTPTPTESSTPVTTPATPAAAAAATVTVTASDDEWYEGLFMSTLLNKLETLMDNSFRTNLRVTAVFAKLAFCPHPLLNNYLLDPSIPVRASVRLPLKLLGDVWTRAQTRASRLPNAAKRLEDMRTRLNADVPPTTSATGETLDTEKFFSGLILLEEFAKELLSVSQAHSNLHAMQALALKAMELPRGKKSEEEEDADKMALLKMASGPVPSSSSTAAAPRAPVKPVPSAASAAAAAATPAARRAATPGATNASSSSSSSSSTRAKIASLLTPGTRPAKTSPSTTHTSSSSAGLQSSVSPRPGSAKATTSSIASPAKR